MWRLHTNLLNAQEEISRQSDLGCGTIKIRAAETALPLIESNKLAKNETENISKIMEGQMTLYRPVGTEELKLIVKSNYRKFPPRLPEQPIFYPVLNEQYATEIASGWNVEHNDDHKGYVLRFEVDDGYGGQFEVHQVGDEYHKELWIPAESLEEFNEHIIGRICIISEFSDN